MRFLVSAVLAIFIAVCAMQNTFASAVVDDFEAARSALRGDDDKQRQEAVRTLAGLGTEEGWELVLATLADAEPRVADEAQLALAEASAEFDALLLGKQGLGEKRGLVALRVAEALGRRDAALDAKRWEKALRHKDAEVRRSLLWSLERLGPRLGDEGRALVAPLTKLSEKDKDELARAHAWLALAAIAPADVANSFMTRAGDSSSAARAACAERIELAGEAEQLDLLGRLARDSAHIVRLRAYEALARREDREGPLALAKALEAEERTRLSWRLVELLQDLSGKKIGKNAQAWQHWADALPEDWSPGDAPAERDYGERSVAFVGMPVLSDRVAFLIDFSGSMWQERDGRTRKQTVDVELRRVLEALPEDARFNLLPFVDEPQRWQKSLESANKKSVAKALKYFEGNHANGKGNYWDAMMLALEDPDVDTLMILGDGAPSGGTRWNLMLISPLFGHANRFRGVFVDALLIDTRGRLLGYWKELTAACGGRWSVVEL